MKTVLFVCTGNTCRSSMAEYIFRDMLNKRGDVKGIKVLSAGISAFPGAMASPEAIEVMKELGIDMSPHRSRALTREMIEKSDLILTMTSEHKRQILSIVPQAENKVFTLKEFAQMEEKDILDPFGKTIDVYRNSAQEIKEALEKSIDKILAISEEEKG
ncbi:protein-tyrosine phosphatase [Caldanaerobius fijiensis DSM 17918]|uniref:Protein-tyrosine phosphatase n=1 Tax=Caldanaerobius fijiensis DSM 17918 TaxID=1121256 RepID=A0A1M4UP88_9THEO|nr:low molecular weight protein arginine phosphatase [Caldanaerobius fijiensis]SHE58519.1 protein-tyrosine phosphatase [Caldanaerobius fijiensis DSM 17918]